MRRRFLLVPALALSAWAQQSPPSAAEQALRGRVEQFYQLELDKKFRQAEDYIAEGDKDRFYNSNKPNIDGFSVGRIELGENAAIAKVYVDLQVKQVIPGFPPINSTSHTLTSWRIENGNWVLYLDTAVAQQTPFGRAQFGPGSNTGAPGAPQDLSAIGEIVKVDRPSIALTTAEPVQTAVISNVLAGAIDLNVISSGAPGVEATLDKTHLEAGEKATIRFRSKDGTRASGIAEIQILPLRQTLTIRVSVN